MVAFILRGKSHR